MCREEGRVSIQPCPRGTLGGDPAEILGRPISQSGFGRVIERASVCERKREPNREKVRERGRPRERKMREFARQSASGVRKSVRERRKEPEEAGQRGSKPS